MTPLCSGVDAMVHAIEAYTSKHKKNLVSDVLAREALALLTSNIRCVNNMDIVCGHLNNMDLWTLVHLVMVIYWFTMEPKFQLQQAEM